MDTISQWEKVSYNDHYIYLRIHENTELINIKGDISKHVERTKKEILQPLIVSLDNSVDVKEGMYAKKDDCGYLRIACLDKTIQSKEDEKTIGELLQLIFQTGKINGHEVVFIPFNPTVSSEKYYAIFNTLMRTNNGIYKSIYNYT